MYTVFYGAGIIQNVVLPDVTSDDEAIKTAKEQFNNVCAVEHNGVMIYTPEQAANAG